MQVIINDIVTASHEVAKDLAGYAAQAAVQTLTRNWQDAHNDQYPGFAPATLAGDLDQVIAILTTMKLRAQAGADADANRTMRAALGLA